MAHAMFHQRPLLGTNLRVMFALSALIAGFFSAKALAEEPRDGLHPKGATCVPDCRTRHAVIFVHGITGNTKDTFRHGSFDWPSGFPRRINGESFDVYTLQYRSAFISWAAASNPNFDDLVDYVFDQLKDVREKGYRSIGFIAHSLGGIVIASYLHEIKARLGHPHRAENSFLITLGTPRSGSYFANVVAPFTWVLLANNPLLDVLKKDNLYLRMSDRLGTWTQYKTTRFGCRPLLVYVGYEKNALIAPMSKESLKRAPPRDAEEFNLSHEMISKPDGPLHPVHEFVERSIADAMDMVRDFAGGTNRLCSDVPYIPERDYSPPFMERLPDTHPQRFLAPKRKLTFLR